jgi:hypothetical protein
MSRDIKNLPIIKASDLKESAQSNDAWDYLFHFTDKYFEILAESPEAIQDFNDSQLVLVAYNYLYGELVNGGFIQMINNGNAYAFEPPFSETINSWGASRIAEIVDKAKVIYEKHKAELLLGRKIMIDFSEARGKVTSQKEADRLERKVWEEHSQIYDKITDFEPLENEFYECMEAETAAIKRYVEKNRDDFGTIV